MRQLLLTTAAAVLALSSADRAAAACVAVPGIVNNATVTCTGDTATGFNQPALDGITLTIEPTATVSNAETGANTIDVRDGLKLTNDGTLTSTEDAINARDNAVITNNGTISGADKTIDLRNGAVITNNGTITGTGETIEVTNNATITNDEGADITGLDDAINPEENVTINNRGRIANVQTQDDVDMMGEAQDGIDVNSGTITNFATGEISSTFGDAIDFDPSTVASSIVDNTGRIVGGNIAIETWIDTENGTEDTQAQAIFNRAGGLIEGKSGLALNLRGGADSYQHAAGATILGGADFGAGDDTMTLLGLQSGPIGGHDALFDGGAGTDTFSLADYMFETLTTTRIDTVLTFSTGGATPFSVRVVNWETFVFQDGRLSYDEVAAAATVVPLPGGMVLLLGALGGFGVLRRRARE